MDHPVRIFWPNPRTYTSRPRDLLNARPQRMQCPKCDSDDLNNLGGKRRHKNFNTRRYECQDCGYRFLTAEKHHRPIYSFPNQHSDHVDRPGEVRDVQE